MIESLSAARPVRLALDVEAPYDGTSIVEFLRRRAVPGVETVDGSRYARTVRLPSGPGALSLDVASSPVQASFWLADALDLGTCVDRARHLLDLDADSRTVDAHLTAHPNLAASVAEHPGLRVPGHVDGFEVVVRAIVGQQISVSGARTILGRLVERYGERTDAPFGLTHLFPAPQRLAAADPAELPLPRSRGRALVAVARAVAGKELILDRSADPATIRRQLLTVPGIGPWTADYVALRALGDPDIFLATDLGVRQGLIRIGIDRTAGDVVEAWSPYRSYAMMHVWKSLEGPAP